MKKLTTLLALLMLGASVLGQESTGEIEGDGPFTKHLTPGLMDTWSLEGKAGETIIGHLTSREFDPVLELAEPGEDGKVLLSVDDKGSESRFVMRLPAAGKYVIRVHAYKFKGGGNYTLRVRRFQASALAVGKESVGAFDRAGRGHHWFVAKRGQVLSVGFKGGASRGWEMLDPKGRRIRGWNYSVKIEDDGEHSLVISGSAEGKYELTVHEARQVGIESIVERVGKMADDTVEVLSFDVKPGEFRMVRVEHEGLLSARVIYAPRKKEDALPVSTRNQRPELKFLPVASKGRHLRFTVMFGREGRYQLQLAARSDASYKLKLSDPTVVIAAGAEKAAALPLGGAAFYGFRAEPGQLITASLTSGQFDPVLRLYDDHGKLVMQNDDGDGGMGSRLTHMFVRAGMYRLRASSLGDGGGGNFQLTLTEQKLKALKIGGRGKGTLEFDATDFWTFTGKEGQTVFLSVRSTACDPRASIYSPDGVRLASDDNGGVGTDSLLAVKLPKAGKYTVWVGGAGAGDYSVRLIDGE
jgi:hypothetical protein